MEQEIFVRFRDLIRRESGISLNDSKKQLLQNRIGKRMRELRLHNPSEYLLYVERGQDPNELVHLIDAISTNLTFFFRERPHFDFLEGLFRQWRQERKREVKLWCAAASSGEEPYSLAISAAEHLRSEHTAFRCLSSDICTTVLQRAMRGIYLPEQLKDVAPELIERYFTPVRWEGDVGYKVKPILQQSLLFKRLNLAQFPYPLQGSFDVIFCRNVMIYFEPDLRKKVVDTFHGLLRPGGHLFVGHSESLSGFTHPFQRVDTAVYRRAQP
ncbi:MAG: protein-glutamate O-methyltransferase CheR [Bdellovibrionales bacterium]|nr:protein-glutamate O-methyltransferase CheR [Bdellovibrionales bacterium]